MKWLRRAGTKQQCKNNASSKVKLEICDLCSDIELIFPLYCSNGAACYISSDQSIDINSKTQAYVENDFSQSESICALMYELRRKADAFNEVTCTQFVIIWKIDKFKRFHLVPCIIEHDKGRVWDKARLMRLAKEYTLSSIPHNFVRETWLLSNNTVLATRLSVICIEECYKLVILISDIGVKAEDTSRPRYIDLGR
jgi:hypothetical protein